MEIQIIAQEFYDYSLFYKGLSKETIRKYKYTTDSYVKLQGITTLSDVTHENVRKLFFYGRAERKWSADTALIFHTSLHVFFNWCIMKGYIDFNPIAELERPRLQHRLPKRLTKQESFRLLEIVSNLPYENNFLRQRNYAIIAMFIFAGLRKKELLNLKYSDVDLDNSSLFVNQGKGAKDRIIPISETLAKNLRLYVSERKRLKRTCPHFFTSSTRNSGFTEDGLKHVIDNLKK